MSLNIPLCACRMKNGRIERSFAWFIRGARDVEEFVSSEDLSMKEFRSKVQKWTKWAIVHRWTVGDKEVRHVLDTFWRKPGEADLKRYHLTDMRRRKVTKTDKGEIRGKHVCHGLIVVRCRKDKDGMMIPGSEFPPIVGTVASFGPDGKWRGGKETAQ